MRPLSSTILATALALAACGGETGQPTDSGTTTTDPGTTATTTDASTEPTNGDPSPGDPTGSPTATTVEPPTTGTTNTSTTDPTTDPTTDATTGGVSECGEVTHFATGKSPTSEIHVSPRGSDGPGCGAPGSPCASLGAAIAEAGPGAAVRLHAGTYAPDTFVNDLAGTADAPIWIGGVEGEARPVISGGGEALHLAGVRYVVLHDLEVEGATANGINVDDGGAYLDAEAARFVVFARLFIHDIGQGGNQDCLKLSGLNDYWILDSEFSACGAGGSAVDHVGCHHGLIVGNNFHDNGGNAVQCKGGSEDIEVRGNTMIESGQRAVNMGGSTGFEFFRPPLSPDGVNAEARDIRVIANVIVGGETPLAFVGCVDCLAANNTIVRPRQWLLRILQETVSDQQFEFAPASNGRFVNNLVVFDRGEISTYVNIGGDTAPETFSFTTNLWYAADDPGQSSPAGDLPTPETGAIEGMDPALLDLAGGDYHLAGGGPAAGSGTALAELTADRDARCWADPPSRGAYELP